LAVIAFLPTRPFRVEFELIEACNLSCSYCYVKPFRGFNPSFEELEYLFLKTKREVEPFDVVLVGGEPFIRKDIIEILGLASNVFKKVGVSTNGTLISSLPNPKKDELRELVLNGKVSVQVSIDSLDRNINDFSRGATDKVLEGLETLEDYGIPFSIGIVITKANYVNVPSMTKDLVSNYSHMRHINLENLRPTKSLGQNYREMSVVQDYGKGSETIKDVYDKVKSNIINSGRKVLLTGLIEKCIRLPYMFDSFGFTTCSAGLLRSTVFANGDVSPCALIRTISLGNLFSESWADIWDRAKERFLDIQGKMIGGQCQINI